MMTAASKVSKYFDRKTFELIWIIARLTFSRKTKKRETELSCLKLIALTLGMRINNAFVCSRLELNTLSEGPTGTCTVIKWLHMSQYKGIII